MSRATTIKTTTVQGTKGSAPARKVPAIYPPHRVSTGAPVKVRPAPTMK
jgi:hypothetical protein